MKILFCTQDKSAGGHYRMKLPAERLKENYDITYSNNLSDLSNFYELIKYNVIVLQRPKLKLSTDFFPFCRLNKIKIIVEIDDLLFEIPDYNPFKPFWNSDILQLLSENIRLADCIVTSSRPLKDYIIKNLNQCTFYSPTYISHMFPFKDIKNDKPHIAFAGSTSHDGDFPESLINYIKFLIEKDKIKFSYIGEVPHFFKGYTSSIPWIPIDQYNDYLYQQNIDIGLIVGAKNKFNDCRSNLKFLEYSSCSICSIASNTYPFKNSINHNKTGLLVDTDDVIDWVSNINFLISNPEELFLLKKKSYEYVKHNFLYDNNKTKFLDKWDKILK